MSTLPGAVGEGVLARAAVWCCWTDQFLREFLIAPIHANITNHCQLCVTLQICLITATLPQVCPTVYVNNTWRYFLKVQPVHKGT